jgi:hypothetical protein
MVVEYVFYVGANVSYPGKALPLAEIFPTEGKCKKGITECGLSLWEMRNAEYGMRFTHLGFTLSLSLRLEFEFDLWSLPFSECA